MHDVAELMHSRHAQPRKDERADDQQCLIEAIHTGIVAECTEPQPAEVIGASC
jgi:hypothetical protein